MNVVGSIYQGSIGGRFRKRKIKYAKECAVQQWCGFSGVGRCLRGHSVCSRNPAVLAARYESNFRVFGRQASIGAACFLTGASQK